MSEPVAEHEVLPSWRSRAGDMARGGPLPRRWVGAPRAAVPEAAAQLSGVHGPRAARALAGEPATPFDPAVLVSVVVPAFNEEENLDALWERLRAGARRRRAAARW